MTEEEQRQQEQEQHRLKRVLAESGKRKAAKVGKKAAKIIAKKVIKGLAVAVKAVLSFLLKLVSPYLLIAIGIIFLVVILFAGTSMLFSFGSSDELGGEAAEIKTYVENKVKSSVDVNKPEQLPYAVPPELIYAVLQIFTGESRTEREIHQAVDIIADKLKPTFEYDSVEEKTEVKTTVCDNSGCSTSESSSSEKRTHLSHVEAWNGTLDVTMQGDWGAWTSSSSSQQIVTVDAEGVEQTETVTTTVETRKYTYNSTENWVEDYTAYERILKGDPFEYNTKDLVFIEQLFNLSGGQMNYSQMSLGMAMAGGGYDFGLIGLNVIPGAGVPAEYMQYYLAGQQAYGIDWYLLAAVHYVETKFSTHQPMISYVGAEGHMQVRP